jgi:hypothetical protein
MRTRRYLAARSVHYELVPRGDRPVDLGIMSTAASKAISDLARSRRARLSIHRWCDDRTVHLGLTVTGVDAPGGIAAQVARGSGADAVALAVCPIPETTHLAYPSRNSFVGVGSLAQALVTQFDVSGLAETQSRNLSGASGPSFVTLSVKPVSTRERNALKEWKNRYLKRTSGLAGGADDPWQQATVLCRGMVVAGSDDPSLTADLSNIGPLLPQFESGLRAQAVTDRFPGATAAFGVAVLGVGLAAAGGFLKRPELVTLGSVVGGLSLITALLGVSNALHVSRRLMRRWLADGLVPIPPRPYLSWRHGVHGGAQAAGNEGKVQVESHPYRLVRRLLVFTPPQLAVAAALPPSTSTLSGTTASRSVVAPAEVREAVGARFAYDPEGAGCQVPDSNRTGGVIVVGDPGKGKSTLLLSIWASDLLARAREYTQCGELKRCLIWLETKGEGASRTVSVARQVGYDERGLCSIDVTADEGPQLDLVDWTDLHGSAVALAESMRYGFNSRAIMDDSEETLTLTIWLALAIAAEKVVLPGEDPDQGYMSVAWKLLGGDPVTGAKDRILDAVSRHLGEHVATGEYSADFGNELAGADTQLGLAYRGYQSKIRSKKSDTEAIFSAPRNKLSKLLEAKSLWAIDPNRPRISFRQILDHKMAVVINFGGERAFPDELRALLGAMNAYLLWQSIKQSCDNWGRLEYSIALFADELADVAGTGNEGVPDVIRLMFDGGRSRGVRPTFATQRLNQIPEATRAAALSSDTKIYLRQENNDEASAAVVDLVGQDSVTYTADDIRRLPAMAGVARIHVGPTLPAAFSIQIVTDDALTPGQIEAPVWEAVRGIEDLTGVG